MPDSFSRASSIIASSLWPLTVHGLRKGRVQILTNGIETYKKLIESLQNAQRTIDVEYYIYRDDQVGRRMTDVLIERFDGLRKQEHSDRILLRVQSQMLWASKCLRYGLKWKIRGDKNAP